MLQDFIEDKSTLIQEIGWWAGTWTDIEQALECHMH